MTSLSSTGPARLSRYPNIKHSVREKRSDLAPTVQGTQEILLQRQLDVGELSLRQKTLTLHDDPGSTATAAADVGL